MSRSIIAGVLLMSVLCPAWVSSGQDELPASKPAPAAEGPKRLYVDTEAPAPLAHVEVRGTGPTALILIPDVACDWTVWEPFMNRNLERFTMYAVTLPGFGSSRPPRPPAEGGKLSDAPWLVSAQRATLQMMETMNLQSPIIVGHGMGGHIAIRIASEHPNLVRSVVSVDGMPAVPAAGVKMGLTAQQREDIATQVLQSVGGLTPEQYSQAQAAWMKPLVSDANRAEALAKVTAKTSPAVMARYSAEMVASDLSEKVRTSRAPILLIAALPTGGFYGASEDELRLYWSQFLGGNELLSIAYFTGIRHYLMDDAPGDFDRAIVAWTEGRPVPGIRGRTALDP